ncbi:hypothetical protein N9X59_02925 [Alphaproteobacteria bacterium]|nr:hypothetical protein [Alphaproteobacteria bacterium]
MSLRDLGTWFASWFEGYVPVFLWQTNWLDAPIFTLLLVVGGYFIIFAGLIWILTYWGIGVIETLSDFFEHREKLRQDEEYRSEWFKKPWRVRHPRVFALILNALFVFFGTVLIIIFAPD